MSFDHLLNAFTNNDKNALRASLEELDATISEQVRRAGTAPAVALLNQHTNAIWVIRLLARAAHENEVEAYLTGKLAAYAEYLEALSQHEKLQGALSSLGGDAGVDGLRATILKLALTRSGMRARDLVAAAAELREVSESTAKYHIRQLVAAELLASRKQGGKPVWYQTTPLGEAVVAKLTDRDDLLRMLIEDAVREGRTNNVREIVMAAARKFGQKLPEPEDVPSRPDIRSVPIANEPPPTNVVPITLMAAGLRRALSDRG